MSDIKTYGSDNLRVDCLDEESGKNIKTNSLFFNLYDFWTLLHAMHKSLFEWYHPKVSKLEKTSRKKLKDFKDLPVTNVLLKKFKEKDLGLSLVNYLEDEEKYFKLVKQWQNNFEKDYLKRYPHLLLEPIRHKKIYRHQKVLK